MVKYRELPRRVFEYPVQVQLKQDGRHFDGMALDAGEKSLGVLLMEPVPEQVPATVEFMDREPQLKLSGTITYCTRTDYGVRIGFILDDEASQPDDLFPGEDDEPSTP